MKKTYLDSERQKMLAKYIVGLSPNMPYDSRGRAITAVTFFLSRATSVSRRGYKDFCKSEANYLVLNMWAKNCICEFLNTRGVGYSRKPKVEAQEEIDTSITKREIRQKEIVDGYIYWLQDDHDYSPHTLRVYSDSVKQYFSYFDEFTQENCRRFIAMLEQKGFKPQTIRLRITSLERLGDYLKKPIKLKRPKYKRNLNTENVPTEAEYQKLCSYLKTENPRYFFLVKLMGTTGCRVSELKQFTFEMIQEGTTTLKGKGSKYRQFFFIKEMQQLAKGRSGLVMLNKYDKPLSERGFSFQLKRYCELCGINPAKGHAHAFRHFFAKMYLKKTKDVIQLAELLGHGSVDTTRIYLQKSFAEQKREVNRVVSW